MSERFTIKILPPVASRPATGLLGWLCSCALLGSLVLVATPAAAILAYGRLDAWESVQVAVAGLICWLAGIGALGLTQAGIGRGWPVQAMLAATFLRLAVPFTTLWMAPLMGGGWADRAWGGTLVGVYLITLAAETYLAVRMVAGSTPSTARGGGVPEGMKVL